MTLTQYDLGAPIAPLPRENPPSIIPFCLTLFNFGTLDDFSNFVNDRNVTGVSAHVILLFAPQALLVSVKRQKLRRITVLMQPTEWMCTHGANTVLAVHSSSQHVSINAHLALFYN